MGFVISNNVLAKYIEEEGITRVVIPDGVEKIWRDAFYRCEKLTSVFLPRSVKELGVNPFWCSNLTEILVDENNPYFTSVDGILYDKDKTTLIYCPTGKKGEVVIPDSVIQIDGDGFHGFWGCTGLTSVHIPAGLKYVVNGAFTDCTGLTSIPIPDNVVRFERFE